LLETGVLGLLGWLWLYIRAVRRLAIRAKLERDLPEGFLAVALAASIAGFGVSMWFYDAFTFTQGNFLMHILIAFSAVLLLQPAATRVGARAPVRAGARGGAPRVAVEV
jgi:O-antigen ligase